MKTSIGKIIPLRHFKEYMFLLEQEKISEGGRGTLLDLLIKHLEIHRSMLDDHYEENSAILAFWSSKLEREKFRLQRLRRKYERQYATSYMRIKHARSGSRITEAEIKAVLSQEAELVRDEDTLDIMEHKVALLKAVVEVIRERKEMVINLGASVRKEIGARETSYIRNEAERRHKLHDVFKR